MMTLRGKFKGKRNAKNKKKIMHLLLVFFWRVGGCILLGFWKCVWNVIQGKGNKKISQSGCKLYDSIVFVL